MKRSALSLMFLLLVGVGHLYAQEVTGKVTSKDDGSPVPFATVTVKGSARTASTTENGTYTIKVPTEATTLVFSFFGMKSQEVEIGGRSVVDVVLESEAVTLTETVVTALGISREKKALGYSVQEVKADALMEARSTSLAEALSGKVAGMNIKKTAQPGGSSQIVIRGQNSLQSSNAPLVVIDGVPFDNSSYSSTNGTLETAFSTGNTDMGDGLGSLSNDDIESISVLKGPSATALYGSRAGNGVVLITTKKGKSVKGLSVSFNSNLTVDELMIQPDFQNTYGTGTGGITTEGTTIRKSWGRKMDGSMNKDWTGQTRPFSPYDNDMYDLFQTGTTWSNSVDVTMSGEKASIRAAASKLDQKGVIPENGLDRTTFTLRGTGTILPKLTFDAKGTYIHLHGHNRPETGLSVYNPMFGIIYNPRSIHWADYQPTVDAIGNVREFETPVGVMTNLLWDFYQKGNDDYTDRLTGFTLLKYEFADWLSLQGRYGIDTYNRDMTMWYNPGSGMAKTSGGNGKYVIGNDGFTEVNADFLLAANKDNLFDSKFSGSLSFGGNIMNRQSKTLRSTATGLIIPGLYNLSNSIDPVISSNSYTPKQIQSLYGFGQLSYDGWLYLDLTARNDWSTTLPRGNWSFFYPSVSLGWVVTDMLRKQGTTVPSWLTFAKLRGSWAKAGNDTNPFELKETYTLITPVIDGVNGAAIATTQTNSSLKPEIVKSYELGAELRFLNNRVGLDFTYYNKQASNQIIAQKASTTSGYSYKNINAGRIDNYGFEVLLNATPIQTKNLAWNMMFGYSKNYSNVADLGGVQQIALGIPGNAASYVDILAKVGQPYGELYVTGYQRDANGNILVSDTGLPIFTSDKSVNVGNMNPDWTGSISSNLTYKGFHFSFMIDVRMGGKIFMNSIMRMRQQGQLEETLAGRSDWYSGSGGYFVNGTVRSTGLPNTKYVNPEDYWNSLVGQGEPHIFGMSNVRMREMSFGYTFPKKWFDKTPINSIKLSLVGSNLFFFYNEMPSYDPECTYTTSNAQGFESASLPSTRSYGFNLNITF